MISARATAAILAGLLTLSCDSSRQVERLVPTAPGMDVVTAEAALASPWASQIVDTTGPGAQYALFVPRNWDENGRRLMVYAHGLVYPDSAIALPVINALRDSLGARGFAVAYSSF